MSRTSDLEAVVATEIERMARLARIGDHATAGPETTAPEATILAYKQQASPIAPNAAEVHSRFVNGYWSEAKRVDAHPGRVGGAITSWTTVVHTTDMLPKEHAALVAAWQTRPGDGACAHFLIDRDGAVMQFIPIGMNGNHAGGPTHGWFVVGGEKWVHPNTVAVGIELHCAGGVHRIAGQWRLVEVGKAHGEPLPDADVIVDPHHADRGWHKVTEPQYAALQALLADLDAAQVAVPANTTTSSPHEAPAPWAKIKSPRVVGHHTLDAYARSDPWPQVYERVLSR